MAGAIGAEIGAAMGPHRDELAGVVVESTYNWYWLVDGLMDAGHRLHLAHPSAIKKYEGLKYSGDFADARYLAQLLGLGLLDRRLHLSSRGAQNFSCAHENGVFQQNWPLCDIHTSD